MKNKILTSLFVLLLASCSSKGSKDGGGGLGSVSDAEINKTAAQAYEEIKTKEKRSTNARWTQMVERVANRIALASGENYQWEVMLIEKNELNAWCMPGGKMAVYTGIMPVLKTEGALAAVMGHEVAHATRKHGKQRYARAVKGNLIGAGIAIASVVGGQLFCKSDWCRMGTSLGGVVGGFMVSFFDRKFSREDETEADQVGQIYMARAGYDPSEATRVWERMQAANGGKAPPEFMSTHPSDQRRKNNLNSWLAGAEAEYSRAPQKFGVGENI
jgi:predicted Zn-dependent protease